LENYQRYVNHLGGYFSIEHRTPDISGPREEKRIKDLIGYLPKEELSVCGFADFIFQATEDIHSLFEGYLKTRMPKEALIKSQGKEYIIKIRPKDRSYFQVYHLIKKETVSSYFNKTICRDIKDICSIHRFMNSYHAGN